MKNFNLYNLPEICQAKFKIFKLMNIFQASSEMFSKNSLECPILNLKKKSNSKHEWYFFENPKSKQ
jgi:hypothetical protein